MKNIPGCTYRMLKIIFAASLCVMIVSGCLGFGKKMCGTGKKYTIVAFGSSVTRGTIGIYPDGKPWTTLLAEKLGDKYKIINSGFNGNSIREAMARCQKDVISHDPDLVMVEFGGNNTHKTVKSKQVSFDEFKDYLAEFKAMLPAKTGVIVITVPPVIDQWHPAYKDNPGKQLDQGPLETYRRMTRDFAAANNYPLFDLYKIIYPNRFKLVLDDGIHLNQAGQQLFADKMFELLQKEGIYK